MTVEPDPDLKSLKRLTRDSAYDSWWSRISPDRRQVLVMRAPAGIRDRDATQVSLWVMNTDGTALRLLRDAGADGWSAQGHAEWSPDGTQMVLHGGDLASPQVFIIRPTDGSIVRQITDRPGANLDPSWSPGDPGNILFVGCPSFDCQPEKIEVYRVPVGGGVPLRLTRNDARDHDAYASREGDRIAWSQKIQSTVADDVWHIFVMGAEGSHPVDLTPDLSVSSLPQWSISPSDQWIYFNRFTPPNKIFGIYRIRPTGGTPVPVIAGGYVSEYPAL